MPGTFAFLPGGPARSLPDPPTIPSMHVRVCVECGEEYRPEITACADCGGQLEDRHEDGDRTVLPSTGPAAGEAGPDAAFTETISEARAATDLTADADVLIEAGIEVRVRPVHEGGYRL